MKKLTLKISGLTLLEITIVVIIMTVMSSLALPKLILFYEAARAHKVKAVLLDIFAAQKRYSVYNNGNYTGNVDALDIDATTVNALEQGAIFEPAGTAEYYSGLYVGGSFTINSSAGPVASPEEILAYSYRHFTVLGFLDYAYMLSVLPSGNIVCTDPFTNRFCGKIGY